MIIELKETIAHAGNHAQSGKFPAGFYDATPASNLPCWEERGLLFICNSYGTEIVIGFDDYAIPSSSIAKRLN